MVEVAEDAAQEGRDDGRLPLDEDQGMDVNTEGSETSDSSLEPLQDGPGEAGPVPQADGDDLPHHGQPDERDDPGVRGGGEPGLPGRE